MADAPENPDWWLASDGQWYPPELHPGENAPTEAVSDPTSEWAAPGDATQTWDAPLGAPVAPLDAPPAPGGWEPPPQSTVKNRTGLLVGLALLVVGLIVIGVIVFNARDDSSSSAASDKTDSSSSDSSKAPSDSSDASSIAVDDVTGPTITAPKAKASLTLPEGWVGTSTEDGVEGLGTKLFPNDPDLAATIDSRAGILPRAVVLFGIDPTRVGSANPFLANVNAAIDPSVPSGTNLESAGKAEARGIGLIGTVESKGLVTVGDLDTYRIEYSAKNNAFGGVAFVIEDGGDIWVVTYSFGDLTDDNLDAAESSVATFHVG